MAADNQAKTPEMVLEALREDLGKEGLQKALDETHSVTFVDRGPRLLVCFETLENTLQVTDDVRPIGLDFAEDKNWSLLQVSANSDSWFRSQAVYDLFDDLVDDCFFEDFDQVIFYGSGVGAYAACAFSVAAPGANVLAIAPQATLDAERAGWDRRFPSSRGLEFRQRYGYAPDMVEGANKVFILFDPYRPLDHVHATLFFGPNVTRLKCRHLDGLIELALREMNILHQVIEAAANDSLRTDEFFQLLRRRRGHARYLRTLLHEIGRRNRPQRVAFLAKYVLEKQQGGPFFRRALARSKEIISRRGPLPDWLLDSEPEGKPKVTAET